MSMTWEELIPGRTKQSKIKDINNHEQAKTSPKALNIISNNDII